MPSRLGARLVTGPLAFLLGGILDVGTLMLAMGRARRRRRAARPPETDALSSGRR